MTAAGTCFGFEIHSPLPFEFLRTGQGQPLEVVEGSRDGGRGRGELVFDWPSTRDQPWSRLYRENGSFQYWVDGGGWFSIEPSLPRVTVPPAREPVRREERLWSLPVLLCFAALADLPLHAAAVEIDGCAVVIAGPHAFGKTTLAAAFASAGHRVLAEDIARIQLRPQPQLVPGPAMLRLRHDVADQLDFRGARTVRRDDERVHLAFDAATRGTCDPLPLRAVVLLRESDDGPTLARVPAIDAVPDLWQLSFRLPGTPAFASSFESLAELVRTVPVWNLFRRLEVAALDDAVKTLVTGV